jgi:hypothetical protein
MAAASDRRLHRQGEGPCRASRSNSLGDPAWQTFRQRMGLDRNPWDIGAVRAILPELAKSCAGFDWMKPANTWSKDELAEFLLAAFNLIQRATAARDAIEEQLAGKPVNADVIARQANGSIGNPRMTATEFNDGADF